MGQRLKSIPPLFGTRAESLEGFAQFDGLRGGAAGQARALFKSRHEAHHRRVGRWITWRRRKRAADRRENHWRQAMLVAESSDERFTHEERARSIKFLVRRIDGRRDARSVAGARAEPQ